MEQKEQLIELGQKIRDAEANVVIVENLLKQAKERRDLVVQIVVPEALDNMGISEFTMDTGERVVVDDLVIASPPKAKRAEAMRWLDDNGHGAIIKTIVSVVYGRDEREQAKQLALNLTGKGVAAGIESKVAPQTLGKWVRDMMEDGELFPLDLFGVHEIRKAKIKKAKK